MRMSLIVLAQVRGFDYPRSASLALMQVNRSRYTGARDQHQVHGTLDEVRVVGVGFFHRGEMTQHLLRRID